MRGFFEVERGGEPEAKTSDWRGERLITSARPVGELKEGELPRYCAYSRCNRRIASDDEFGVCSQHRHANGLCCCSNCRRRGA